jgi:hypothetical protein
MRGRKSDVAYPILRGGEHVMYTRQSRLTNHMCIGSSYTKGGGAQHSQKYKKEAALEQN